MTASTARAKAMSVAVGMAQPRRTPPPAAEVDRRGRAPAGTATPHDRGGDRQRGLRRVAQVTGDELALELEAGDEEEDREEAVGRPVLEGQVQVQRGRADGQSRNAGVGVRHGEFAQTSAATAAASSSAPPTVSVRRASATRAPRARSSGGRSAAGRKEGAHGGTLRWGRETGRRCHSPTRLPGTPGESLSDRPSGGGAAARCGHRYGRAVKAA